ADVRSALDRISSTEIAGSRATSVAIANLAEGIQGLVQHMRSEQQLIRDWVEAQAAQQRDIKRLLERLASETERS
ncbi:MAG TPA: flagellar motor protein MotA, partial [Beijerinckiaceae bacterium]|nr:flagellar motor protein MotA [Beijerinckiaceae bacterium]